MTETVREFVNTAYSLVSADSPTVPLQGSDNNKGLFYLNRLLKSFAGTGLKLTVAKELTYALLAGKQTVTFADASFIPAADVAQGRLANLLDAWIELNGLTYPLDIYDRNLYHESYKYEPLESLPQYVIMYYETNVTSMRIYPAPSQAYTLHIYGKYELSTLTKDSTMAGVPDYYLRYLTFALAKDIALFKGRSAAWTPELEKELVNATNEIEAISTVNLVVKHTGDNELNGAWRVRSGT